MRKNLSFYILFLLFASLTSAQGQEISKDTLIEIQCSSVNKLYKTVSSRRVSVHDPSIAVDNSGGKKTYYVFGSHLGVAYTSDLLNWSELYNASRCNGMFGTEDDRGVVSSLPNFNNAYKVSCTKSVKVLHGSDTVVVDFGPFNASDWNTSSGVNLFGVQWAPDVIWNPYMQKWCMYMSLNGENWRSVIVLLTSDKITGPYVYQGPVTYSGFQWTSIPEASYKLTDLELVLGTQSSLPSRYDVGSKWGDRWPNNIDPCTFFDDEGQLWMTYGSWSGGIFILKLNKYDGLRDYTYVPDGVNNNSNGVGTDPYFGKRIAGGYYASGEGSYIQKIGKYYFLFVTNGGLESNKGYEMHVFRSSNPDGPYVDIAKNQATYNRYVMNYGPNAGTTAGLRLMGPYQWENMNVAELSQGHNSAFVDDDGCAYIIYHTRFNNGTEGHQVRVHPLFLNKEGWLLAAPFEHEGESYSIERVDTSEICTTNDIVGTWQLMLHPYKMDYANKAFSTPFATVYFGADGSITGSYMGKWSVTLGTSYVSVSIRKRGTTGSTVYSGVIVPQIVSGTNMRAVCFTGVANNGVALWGCNADDKLAVDYNYQQFKSPVKATDKLTTDVDLTIPTYYGAEVSWSSSRPDLLTDLGKHVATNDSLVTVKLTCTIRKDNYFTTRTVSARVQGDGTDVKPLNAEETDDLFIDLSGRYVLKPESGQFYILNGKKVFIK
ncbi:MAG: glycoside hydrolase family 43 protein [Bacteroidaceae bacterium]|nr:glycoside hydrolase family 43 protein [Bacteroidaceae bacterium]